MIINVMEAFIKMIVARLAPYVPSAFAARLVNVPGIAPLMRMRACAYVEKIVGGTVKGTLLKNIYLPFSLEGHVFCQHQALPDTSFTGKKVALVAHWDPGGVVDPYVIYYMNALKNIGYSTVLISTAPVGVPDEVLAAADAVLWRGCPGYDFTSWKAAFEYYPSLFEAREILITNDSIFGPMHPLSIIYETMDKLPCDFWGLVLSTEITPHLQSHYIVFRSKAIGSPALKSFISAIDTTEDKREVIFRYELKLTDWLQCGGLTAGAYITPANLPPYAAVLSPGHVLWWRLLRDLEAPFLKRAVLTKKSRWIFSKKWEKEVLRTGYPSHLIHDYLQRIRLAS